MQDNADGQNRIRKASKRMKKIKFLFMTVMLCLFGCESLQDFPEENTAVLETTADMQAEKTDAEDVIGDFDADESRLIKRNGKAEDSRPAGDGDTLEVHYMDIGQGDSILIKQGEKAMLIDAGNNSKGTAVWSYLLSQNVKVLDYAVGTHPDADHIGGLDVVLYKLDCGTVFLPGCKNDTRTYEELMETIAARNQQVITPVRGETYSLGKAKLEMLTDTGKDYGDNINDYSIAIRLTFGSTSFLFTGDAEEAAERDMMESGLALSADVYKAAHHGADTANTESFLTAVNPRYCVISCGKDNSYGHPRAGFLNNLRKMGVEVFRTDEQGSIIAVSDGENISFNTGPSVTWQAGEPVGSSEQQKEENPSGKQYILNTSTRKFHRPDCGSVDKMADRNKKKSGKSREELMADGYEPCKNCNP